MAHFPEASTPEYWERYGCEGANEYRDCESMSADYARLRRMERRLWALAEAWGDPTWSGRPAAAPFTRALRMALVEPEVDE